jgi:hypothetical protein
MAESRLVGFFGVEKSLAKAEYKVAWSGSAGRAVNHAQGLVGSTDTL